ncbi:MAG: UTP--glucose-1-phosphate uridylyltransferase [Clostridia bacterium]|nr:UTP--glucose-1-phosphate uridylyltransferase [Clostridia bacterium]
MKITKAVIPAAGLGTRMLPIARAVPKEMLPIVDRPAMSYLVEEAAKSGITDILIITGRNKEAIEDYFDYSPEYEAAFERKGRPWETEAMRACAAPLGVRVFFMRQKEALGLGHAILCAESFVGNEPFAVLYGDDIIFEDRDEKPVTAQLIDSFEKYGRPVCGVKPVPRELVKKYCSLKAEPIADGNGEYFVDDMIEKPQREEEIFSNLSILGRVILTPEIFDILKRIPNGAGGELQLTDAIAEIARKSGVTALEFRGTRYDLGSKLGLMTANVVRACVNQEIGDEFRAFLRDFVKNMD